jgi:hypothetical protein
MALDPTNLLQAPQDQSQVYQTPDAAKARFDWAQALLKQSQEAVPGTKGGWTMGVRNIVDALIGGDQAYKANQGILAARQTDQNGMPIRQNPYGTPTVSAAPAPYAYAPDSNNVDSASSDALHEGAGNSSPKKGDPRGLSEHIKETAKKYGIDPEVALRVASSEGLSNPVGDNGTSFGAFQLHTGGGLGDKFKKVTGLDPADPKNEKATIDFALQEASKGGWGPWMGAKKIGLAPDAGISALAFNGQPSSGGGDAQSAIVTALAGGKPAAGPTGVPAGSRTAQYVDPFAVPRRPHISEEQFRNTPGFYNTPEERTIRNDAYYNEYQPQSVPYMGGNVIVNPRNPNQQFFSPGVQWNEYKAGDSSFKAPVAIVPDGKGGFKTQVIEGGKPATAPATDSNIKPPAIGPGNGPASAAPAAPAPAAPAPGPSPVKPIPTPGAAEVAPGPTGAPGNLPFGINGAPTPPAAAPAAVGQNPAANQVASNVPMATPGAQPAPGPAETGAAVLDKAQAAVPPSVMPGAAPSPLAGPMGAKVAAALATQPPPAAPGVKTAEVPPELQELRDFSLDTKRRGALIEGDTKNYTDAQKTLQQNSGPRASNAIKQLEMAKQLVDDPRFYSGPLADWVQQVQKIRAVLGKDPGMAAPMEIFNKIISGDVVQELKQQLGGLGQIRLAEINLINQSVANLYNTPAANRAVLDIMTRVNQQSVKIGEVARAYDAGWRWDPKGQPYRTNEPPTNAGLTDAINQYTQNNPLFSDKEMQSAQQTFKIAQEAGKAKPNTKYEPLGNVTSPQATPASATSNAPAQGAPAGGKENDPLGIR